jgi:hypothetical protein
MSRFGDEVVRCREQLAGGGSMSPEEARLYMRRCERLVSQNCADGGLELFVAACPILHFSPDLASCVVRSFVEPLYMLGIQDREYVIKWLHAEARKVGVAGMEDVIEQVTDALPKFSDEIESALDQLRREEEEASE